jgi:hypothetical protein
MSRGSGRDESPPPETMFASTRAGSITSIRPHLKASLLASTAAPFSSIACSMASGAIGRQPRCRAAPSRTTLAVVVSPSRPIEIRPASR